MPSSKLRAPILGPLLASAFLSSCARPGGDSEGDSAAASAIAVEERLAACDQDPRVIAGLIEREVCAGADLYFREASRGQGRRCGSCHPVEDTSTIELPLLDALLEASPLDALSFILDREPEPADLEVDERSDLGLVRGRLRGAGGALLHPRAGGFATFVRERLERQAR
ncbi:uncharacterized protein SOCEGT47_001940 [Sorangium cellulosum]|uniref:Cytochrome c domain-containing protein n=1 Tax=Sorangium cellulosum TaxID=56 RepID=A0A4V0NCN0_SORCE|nr:hypothetical protein [Sorangium cellulosum]AUX19742.1 uncharacterized protein SOCEGT47_001940 [Sorangium cellulosum]